MGSTGRPAWDSGGRRHGEWGIAPFADGAPHASAGVRDVTSRDCWPGEMPSPTSWCANLAALMLRPDNGMASTAYQLPWASWVTRRGLLVRAGSSAAWSASCRVYHDPGCGRSRHLSVAGREHLPLTATCHHCDSEDWAR